MKTKFFLLLTLWSALAFGADVKISDLPAGAALTGVEEVPAVQGGDTVKTTPAAIATYVESGLTKADVGLGNVDNTSNATERAATATLTNKTIDGDLNTLQDIGNASLANSSITLNGAAIILGGTRNLDLASADFANQGTATTVLHGNAAGNPSWGAVDLTTDVTGDLPDANLSANVPLLNAVNTFTGAGNTFNNAAGITTPSVSLAGTATAPSSEGIYRSAASTVAIRTSSANQITVSATAATIAPPITAQGLISANVGAAVRKGTVTISASERAKVGGVIYQNTTTTGNTAATETDAFSHSVTANTLGADGESLEFRAAGTIAGTANVDKRIKVVFGTTTIFDSGTMAITSAASWKLEGTIVRTSTTTQKITVTLNTSSSVLPSTTTYTAGAETLTSAKTMKLTLNGTSASDVVGEFYKEDWSPFQ